MRKSVNLAYIGTVIAKLGPLVSAAAGSIGGTTIQRNGPSVIIRSKPLPIYRGTPYASGARQQVAAANVAWGALTEVEREDWQTFSETLTFYNRFGDVIPSRGYLAFTRQNFGFYGSRALWVPHAIQSAPPAATESALPVNPLVLLESGGLDLQLHADDTNVPSTTDWAIFATRPKKPLVPPDRPTVSDGMLIAWCSNGDPLPVDLTSGYVACFGRLPIPNNGENCAVRILAVRKGHYWPGLSTYMIPTPI